MRKVLIGFVTLIVLAIATVLIVPGFIDWNEYKQDITRQVQTLTGRQLIIGGNIEMTVLPAPAITVNEVSFANADGSKDAHMVRLDSLEVQIALGPLLGGEVVVRKIRVMDPVVLLEVLPDGQSNWDIDIAGSSTETPSATVDLGTSEPSQDSAGENNGTNIRLDNVELVNATIIYRDAVSGIDEHIEQLNVSFKAASLQGPFESIGSVVVRGMPVSYELAIDGIFQGRTMPVSVLVRSEEDGAEIQVTGNVFNLSEDPKFSGTVKSKGQSLAALLHTLAGIEGLPGALNQSFSLISEVNATGTAIDLTALEMKLGDTALTGSVQVDINDIASVAIDLSVKHLNVDNLVGLVPFVPEAAEPAVDTSTNDDQSEPGSTIEASAPPDIPANIVGAMTMVVEAMTYRGVKAGPVRLNTELSNGEITISQFTAQLPGATEITLFGFASIVDGELVFDGESEISMGDTRRLAQWLDVDMSQIPSGRLRHMEASANVRASRKDIRISDIKASFDSSSLAGGITLALRKRPAFGASFALDYIDLDGYLQDSNSSDSGTADSSGTAQTASGAAQTVSDPLAALSALTTFDANIHMKVGEVIHEGISIRDIDLNTGLLNGTLTINNASVKDIAGTATTVAGKITDLGGNPKFVDMNLVFGTKSVAKLVRAFDIQLPVSPEDIGRVKADVTINGTAFLPTVSGSFSALGASASLDGRLSALPVKPMIDVDMTLSHGNTAKLLRVLGIAYQPAGNIGGLDFAAHVRGGPGGVSVTNLDMKQGDVIARGDASITLDTPRPVITANLQTNAITVEPFLSAGTDTPSATGTKNKATSNAGSGQAVPSGAPWPRDQLELGALNDLDAQIRLQSAALKYGAITVKDVVILAKLVGGVLTAEDISGVLFGGTLGLSGVLDARTEPAFDSTLSFKNIGIGPMLSSLTGEQSAVGTLTFGGKFSANGNSVADMVSVLDGTGSFSIKGLDVKGDGSGTPLAAIMELVRDIGQSGAGLAGSEVDGLANAGGTFTMNDGVARTGDFVLSSELGNGTAAGFVDLVGWNMDISGTVHLTQNILTALLANSTGAMDTLPFSITGAPDDPAINMDTASLLPGGGGIPIPGLDKLEEKLPGVDSLLQGILGDGSSQTTTRQPPAPSPSSPEEGLPEPEPQQQQAPKKITPQDIISQILQF